MGRVGCHGGVAVVRHLTERQHNTRYREEITDSRVYGVGE